MRRTSVLVVVVLAPALLGWGWPQDRHALEWPQAGPMPDDPVKVKPYVYAPVTSGNQSYRPIEPLPWGDVNRRVAPPGSLPGAPPAKKQGSDAAPAVAPKLASPSTPPVPVAPKALPNTPAVPASAPKATLAPSGIPPGQVAPVLRQAPQSSPPTAVDHKKHGSPVTTPEGPKP